MTDYQNRVLFVGHAVELLDTDSRLNVKAHVKAQMPIPLCQGSIDV
jgi:hypothetical protein